MTIPKPVLTEPEKRIRRALRDEVDNRLFRTSKLLDALEKHVKSDGKTAADDESYAVLKAQVLEQNNIARLLSRESMPLKELAEKLFSFTLTSPAIKAYGNALTLLRFYAEERKRTDLLSWLSELEQAAQAE